MFGGKKPAEAEAAPFDNEGYDAEYEYQAHAFLGIGAFNKEVAVLSRRGWELVNGCMAGTAHYAYMRRRLKKAIAPTEA